jgi:HPt (histidine-containing phosphotransfer) domain-containing protein
MGVILIKPVWGAYMSEKRYSNEVVYVDPDFEDLIPPFLESRGADIRSIRESLVNSDMSEIRRLGHGMKGAGAGYGFPEVTRLGAVIEEAAKRGDAQSIEEAVVMLAEYLSAVEIRVESE